MNSYQYVFHKKYQLYYVCNIFCEIDFEIDILL